MGVEEPETRRKWLTGKALLRIVEKRAKAEESSQAEEELARGERRALERMAERGLERDPKAAQEHRWKSAEQRIKFRRITVGGVGKILPCAWMRRAAS